MTTLFAVHLDTLHGRYRTRPLAGLAADAPRGRVAPLVTATAGDRARPAAQAPAGERRGLWEAIVEDGALAAVWDAPAEALAAAGAPSPDGGSAAPADVDGTLVRWLTDAAALGAARAAAEAALAKDAPDTLERDVLEAWAELLRACARSGVIIIGRSR